MVATKITEINIRDPYILPHNGKYYLYGTRSETCWGEADGFDCYVSDDFENWDGPTEIFIAPMDFRLIRITGHPNAFIMMVYFI